MKIIQNPAFIIAFAATALLILGGVAAYDFLHIPSLSFHLSSYFTKSGVAFGLGIVLFVIMFKFNRVFLNYEVALFIAGLILLASPLLFQFVSRNNLFISTFFIILVNPWGFLLTFPLLNSIKRNDKTGIKTLVFRLLVPWAVVNFILLMQPDYPMFLLYNIIVAVLMIRRKTFGKLKAIVSIAIIVFLVLSVAIVKKGSVERHLEYTKLQLEYMQSNTKVVPVSCIYNIKKTGWTGAGIDFFREATKNNTIRLEAKDFMQSFFSVYDFPLKIICQQTGIFGFIMVLFLFFLLVKSFWKIITSTKCKNRFDLSVIIFLLLFLPAGFQLFNNLLPLAVIPNYHFYFLAFHPHAIIYTFALTGLILGIHHSEIKQSEQLHMTTSI